MEPDELVQDDSKNDEPFDPDQTLPYMLGDDPDLTLPYMFGDESISVPVSDSAGDIESQQSKSHCRAVEIGGGARGRAVPPPQ